MTALESLHRGSLATGAALLLRSLDLPTTLRRWITWGDDAESLTVTAAGKVTVEAVDEVVQTILGDSRYGSGLRILIDSRAGEVANLTSSEARRRVDLLARDADRIGNPRIAVAVSRKVDFGVARTIESLADGRWQAVLRIFDDIDEARAWLWKAN